MKKRTKYQVEPGLHGLSFRQKWREYAQNMLLLSACFPATDAKLTEKSTCMRFFGEKAEGRKFLLIFLIKILINISKTMKGLDTVESLSAGARGSIFLSMQDLPKVGLLRGNVVKRFLLL